MLDKRHNGMQITIAMMVTSTEPKMNGQNPNFPSEGDQSDEVMRLPRECVFNNGKDFKIKPVPIAKGNNKQKNRHKSIHFEEILSLSFLDTIMPVLLLVVYGFIAKNIIKIILQQVFSTVQIQCYFAKAHNRQLLQVPDHR